MKLIETEKNVIYLSTGIEETFTKNVGKIIIKKKIIYIMISLGVFL